MSSSLAPAAPPPDTSPTELTPFPGISPSSQGNDKIAPITSPVVPIQVPLPSFSPPQIPAAFPPILPVVLPLPSPPQPLPEPPVSVPTPPLTKDVPTPEIIASPPSISPPPNVPDIVTLTPPSPQPPLLTSPPSPDGSQTGPGPGPDPLKPGPSSHIPAARQPVTTKPGPSSHIPADRQTKPGRPGPSKPDKPDPSSQKDPADRQAKPGKPNPSPRKNPADRQTKTDPTSTNPGPPIAAAAVFPSQPPIALPVPQTPRGGAWFPDTSTPPSILPSIPGSNTNTPVVVNNTPLIGDGVSSSSSLVPGGPGGSVHQNIEASVPSVAGGSSVFIVGLIVGGILLLLFAAVVCILLFFCRKKQSNKFDHQNASDKMLAASFKGIEDKTLLPRYTKQGPNNPPVNTTAPSHLSNGTFTYDDLATATSGFSDHNLLGQGGFGCVYKGVLPNGKEIAVKQLKMGGHQGEREFRAEVDTISQVHHKHLVSLVGFCISGVERLLVYEFVDNNTLDFHLHGKEQPVMDWPTRLKIAIGSAKGLAYLHEDCSPSIIHRDIKAANILLDFNYEAKVSDFGLAKIFSTTNPSVTHMTTRVVGTFGYLAPEYASSGKVTDKSDVYSYGVVLLELITGRTPLSNFGPSTNGNLVNWARPLLAQAIADGNFDTLADSRLQKNYNVDEMTSMLSCAAACVRLSSWRRPRMSQVIRALEGNLSASELDGGAKAGHSLTNFPYENLDFDARNYIEDMKKMALASSTYSDNTSDDYGLNLSVSSSDTGHHIY